MMKKKNKQRSAVRRAQKQHSRAIREKGGGYYAKIAGRNPKARFQQPGHHPGGAMAGALESYGLLSRADLWNGKPGGHGIDHAVPSNVSGD